MDTPDSTTMKTCRTCGLDKPIQEFYIGSNDKPVPDCKPCKIEKSRKYQLENADKVRENHRRWRKENAEHYRQYHRDWRKRNTDSARGAVHRYAKSEKGRAVSFNRKSKLRGSPGKISANDKKDLRAAQTDKRGRLRCWWCGKPIEGTPHLDHKIPIVAGGRNDAGNLCYSCRFCNQSKNAKSPAEFAGRLL